MIDRGRAAQCALLAHAAEAMFDGVTLAPPLDAETAASWTLVGHLTARDALFGAQAIGIGERVYYGFVAQSKVCPTHFVAVIRGTLTALEWIENIEGLLVPGPHPSLVEHGFWSIYDSMQYVDLLQVGVPAASGIAQRIPAFSSLTVIGHSLGAALATYLLCHLAPMARCLLGAVLIASPKPGDGQFAHDFDALIGRDNYIAYAYIRDIVVHVPPSLPFGLGFQSLPNTQWITPATAQAAIHNDPACNHHATSYAAMLDRASVQPNGCVLPQTIGIAA